MIDDMIHDNIWYLIFSMIWPMTTYDMVYDMVTHAGGGNYADPGDCAIETWSEMNMNMNINVKLDINPGMMYEGKYGYKYGHK